MSRVWAPTVLAVLLTHPLSAQSLPTVVEGLRPDQVIRILTATHGTHIGRFVRVAADTVYLTPERGSEWVHLGAIDALWVRGTAGKTGALVGAIVGAVTTGTFIGILVNGLCETDNCDTVEAVLVGGAIGAAGGGLFGLVVGTFINKWHRRWP